MIRLQRCQFGVVDDCWDFRVFNGQHGEGIYCFPYGDRNMRRYYSSNGENCFTFEIDEKYLIDLSNKKYNFAGNPSDYWEVKKFMYNNPQYKAFKFKHVGPGIPSSYEILITDPEIIKNIRQEISEMKHLKLYESISNYQVRLFTRKQFSDFIHRNREKYHVFGEENHLKSRIKYFGWEDIGYSTSAHWLKKHYDTLRFIVAYNDDDILGICKFAWFDFQKHYSMSYCNTNKNYYQLGVSKRLLESLFKYFSKTYPDDILHFSGYSIMGWKYLRTTILKLSEKYKVKIKEKSIEYDYSWDTDSEIVNKSQEVIKKLYPQHEAISVERATKLNYQMELPRNPIFTEAVKNTKGAELTPDGLVINITRYQAEYQAGSPSIRTGVFYLPTGSPQEKYYRGGKYGYGGKEKYQGTTLIRRPIFVKGGTGGKAPELAYDLIKGKGAYQKMRQEVLKLGGWGNHQIPEDVADILTKYNNETDYDDNYNLAYSIIEHSKKGNTLYYAIQENIVAHAVRDAGYDSVLGYSTKRDGSPFISEIFDVREITYPMQDEESDIHSAYL